MPLSRIEAIDALRGFAMLWMTAYHFAFDLNQAKFWPQDFYGDPLWTWQRTLIVSLFLFCAGFSQAWALTQGQSLRRFLWRWSQIFACALLVSLGSWWMFADSWIYFGILHGMLVMLVLVRLSRGWGQWLWLAGAAAIASKFAADWLLLAYADPQVQAWFNGPVLNWLGWISQKPITQDYAPVFPWLGVMWWGAATADWLIRSGQLPRLPEHPVFSGLAKLGRWSLSYYMLHQPVLIALVAAGAWVLGR